VRLSTKTSYGVRAVFDMAYHGAGGPTQAKDIARRQEIPLRYLEQIFQDLKKAGIVDSKRGPRGGYQLKAEPKDIKLGDVVRALQGPIEEMFASDESPTPNGRRRSSPGASSRQVTSSLWRELAGQVTAWFDNVSLADMVKKGAELGVPRTEQTRPMYFI
jgi:Rrf2 family transcriptional regulator, iron-sulfur cluster assembly transcription factor